MKKFAKILPRRLQGRSEDGSKIKTETETETEKPTKTETNKDKDKDKSRRGGIIRSRIKGYSSSAPPAPALGSARDHHQLSLRKGIPTKRPTRTGASRIVISGPLIASSSSASAGETTDAANHINGRPGRGYEDKHDETVRHDRPLSSIGIGAGVLSSERQRRESAIADTNYAASHAAADAQAHTAAAAAALLGTGAVTKPNLCQPCAAIGFPRLFDWKPGEARPWIPLSHCLRDDSSCPYCTFFQAMIGHVPGTDADDCDAAAVADSTTDAISRAKPRAAALVASTFTPYFRIRHAFERLGVSPKHELGRSVLFQVTTRNKSLTRGYILRAVDDETGLEGYLEGLDEYLDSAPGDAVASESSTQDGRSLLQQQQLLLLLQLQQQPQQQQQQQQHQQHQQQQQASALLRGRSVTPFLDPCLPHCWINYCKEHHLDNRCATKQAASGKVPLKLIDINARQVIFTADLDAGSREYVALSYAVGDTALPPFSEQNDLPSDLPRQFNDALSLASSLGYRYIWIDHYCLPPRDKSRERRQQLDLLGEVFAQSVLTVIVAAGDGIFDGIPGVSVPRDEDQLSLQNESGLFTTSLLRPDVEVAASRWAGDAWTLQQGLLARRRLVLTPSQSYFQCGALHCQESISLPLRLASGFPFGRIFPADGINKVDIRSVIGTYMTREPLHTQDRLDPLRGLLRAFSTRTNNHVEIFMGLPLFDPDSLANIKVVSQTDRLAIALSWMWSSKVVSSSQETDGNLVGSCCYLDKTTTHFPSWTWLSWHVRRQEGPHSQSSHSFIIPLARDSSSSSSSSSSFFAADGLCAPPRMEISVGFADGLLVSWEIDGAAISRRAEAITFLRINTLCFDVCVRKKETGGWRVVQPAGLFDDDATRDVLMSCVRATHCRVDDGGPGERAAVGVKPDDDDDGGGGGGGGEFMMTAVLLTGTNWRRRDGDDTAAADIKDNGNKESKGGGGKVSTAAAAAARATKAKAKTSSLAKSKSNWATVLLCAPREWKDGQPLVRVGVFSFAFMELNMVNPHDGGESTRATMKGVVASSSSSSGSGGVGKDLDMELRELDLY